MYNLRKIKYLIMTIMHIPLKIHTYFLKMIKLMFPYLKYRILGSKIILINAI